MPNFEERPEDKFGYYRILRDAPPGFVEGLPPPESGQFVIITDPQNADEPHPGYLGLLWPLPGGGRALESTEGYVISGKPEDATWLPRGWRLSYFPIGWELAHLERWFDIAIYSAEGGREAGRPGPPPDPQYDLAVRDWVSAAFMIVRHLRLPHSPTEPRGPMDRAGCVAELRDLIDFFRRALGPKSSHGMTVTEANKFAMRLAKQMGKKFFRLSQREQAKKIGCSWATWHKTEFYSEAQKKRRLTGRRTRGKNPGSPPVVGLTKNLENVSGEGVRDQVLAELIEEQEADYEASPIEADPPGSKPRRIHVRKRL
jgi:hypothetical protein